MSNQIYSFNRAEGVFYPAFDKYLCDDSQITAESCSMERLWDSLVFRGGKEFSIIWKGEVKLGEYDSFLCFLSVPPHGEAKGSAVVNGKTVELFTGARGGETPSEWRGAFDSGKDGLLTQIRLDFTFQAEKNVVSLSWLGLMNTALEAEAEAEVPVWKEEWCREIRAGICGQIRNNLILSKEEGEQLRRVFAQDKNLAQLLRRHAQEGMKLNPKELVREYVPVMPHMYRFARVKDRGREVLEGRILNLAVAGYLLEEASYSYQAAKLILALIAMKWYEGPVCGMEGSRFHHVCFTEDHMLTEAALALGFLDGLFSDQVLLRIQDRVEEAWKFVRSKCLEPGYRNFMNQGIVGCRGMMIGAAFLNLWKGGYEAAIQEAYERHTRLVENYLTENGHCAEGPSYYEYSFSSSILLWHIYARFEKKPVGEVVPERFKRSGRYLEALLRAGEREGVRIPLNCGGTAPASMLLVTFLTAVGDFPEGNNYLIARLSGDDAEKSGFSNFDLLFYEYYRRMIDPHPYYRAQQEEISFPGEGLLSWRRGNTKLLVTAERNPMTGHFHEDRGGVILEADGELLLPDIGTTSYSNPVCLLMDKKEYHNLACPSDLPMLAESITGQRAAAMAAYPIEEELTMEDMEIPEAKVLYADEKQGTYEFAVETGMLFGAEISGVRRGRLEERYLSLEDSWSFPESHPLTVTYLSYHPWRVEPDHRTAVSGRMTLCVSGEGKWEFQTEDGMVDSASQPVYVLQISSAPAVKHRICSEITWTHPVPSPKNTGKQNQIAIQALLDQGGTIRIEEPGVYEVEDTLLIGSHTHLLFGAGVFLKRTAGSVGSFVLINRGAFTRTWDEDIRIEGLHLITNGVEARHHAAVYGLTGELSFFYVKQLRIFDFTCMDLPRLSYGIHVCTFEDLVIERVHIEGRKDAVHLGTGSKFVIRHGLFRTFDDPIALNAHDYAVANPQMGWIEDGLIEDCYDLPAEDTTGYFCRILAGAWVDWYPGMEIQNSDTVVHNGRVYRAFQKPDGTKYRSLTPPVHTEGMETHDGIHWVMVQEEVTYECGCRNIHFKDIHLQKERETALSIHFDHDQYSRSVYPGAKMPVQENLVFENLVTQNRVKCLVRSITPVNTIKILNSVIGDSNILLESLPEEPVQYPVTQVLLLGNTFTAKGKTELITCDSGRSCKLKAAGNLVLEEDFLVSVSGAVDFISGDLPVETRAQIQEGEILIE